MREGLIAFGVGGVAGAAIGGLAWWYAQRKVDQGFEMGAQQLAQELGVGTQELQARFAQGQADLEQQISQQVNAQVPAQVQQTIQSTLTRYGITKERATRFNAMLDFADSRGWL